MAQYQFTIAAGDIGAGDPASDTVVVADRGLKRNSQLRVLTASFGDGYEQRVKDGINTKNDMFSITFNNRSAEEINRIAAFFDAKTGNNFDFIVTDHAGDTTIKVVCEGYNIDYIHDQYHSMSCSLRRVYEP